MSPALGIYFPKMRTANLAANQHLTQACGEFEGLFANLVFLLREECRQIAVLKVGDPTHSGYVFRLNAREGEK